MGFRFRRSVRILPGVRLNFSGSGISTSLGVRGATVNIGKRGVRGTVGLPGTGLTYSRLISRHDAEQLHAASQPDETEQAYRVGVVIGRTIAYAMALLLLVLVVLLAVHESSWSGPIVAPSTPARAHRFVNKQVVNCRAQPNVEARIVLRLTPKDPLLVGDIRSGWVSVTVGTAQCWTREDLIG